jgi:hypothetical protein
MFIILWFYVCVCVCIVLLGFSFFKLADVLKIVADNM